MENKTKVRDEIVDPPEGLVAVPEGFNALVVYALDTNGVYLPALSYTSRRTTLLAKPLSARSV